MVQQVFTGGKHTQF